MNEIKASVGWKVRSGMGLLVSDRPCNTEISVDPWSAISSKNNAPPFFNLFFIARLTRFCILCELDGAAVLVQFISK